MDSSFSQQEISHAAVPNQPLVSVVIVSYHSAETIEETLDSIYNQTYPNIELIVSDDCSTDDTVAVAQDWAQTHADRFVNCIIHSNPENLGISGNMNAGIRLSSGYYVKDLAADDLLMPTAIAQYVSCCQENSYNNLCARVKPFFVKDGEKVYLEDMPVDFGFYAKDSKEQYPDMLVEDRIFSPAFFSTRQLLDEMGLYDPRYRFAEDYPMYLKISAAGYKLNFMDVYTVEYRQSENSMSHIRGERAVHPGFHKTLKKFFFDARFKPLLKHKKFKRVISELRWFICNDLIILFGNNTSRGVVRSLLKLRDKHF